MKDPRHIRLQLLAGFLLAVLVPHLPVFYTLFYHQLTGAPTAVNADISLSDYSGKRTVLDGEWEFFWNRLLITEPQQGAVPDFSIPVPGYWSVHQLSGSYLPANGYASYRLTLKDISYSRPVTVYLPDFGSAYRAYIDGQLVSESGVVSKNTAEVFTTPNGTLYPATLAERQEHEIVIETATTRFSGLYKAPVLEDYTWAVQEDNDRNALHFLLFGTVLFSFFILTVVYILSYRRGIRSAWPIALVLCVLLRLMLVSEFYAFWQSRIFFNLSFEATNEPMFLISFALKFLMIFLYQEQFGIRFSRREKTGFLLYYSALFLAHCFIPYGFYNRHLTVLLPAATFLLEIYSFFKVYFSERKLRPYALLIYWGTIIAAAGLGTDCYYTNGNIYPNLSQVLLCTISVYLTLLSVAYVLRVMAVYREFEVSSARLALARNHIAMQTEYYDALSAQMNEVRAVRHDVRHFVGALKRLSDEGQYEELGRFLNEYAEKSDTEPLPVFCENIVANSILGYYSLRFKECSTPFHCACSIPKQLSVSDSDLCVVLGNALENALEACGKLEDPEARSVTAEARTVNGQLLIKIANAYNGTLNQRESRYLTTKDSPGHGIGLQNIQKVVDSYGGFVRKEHSETVFTLMAAFPEPLADAPPMDQKQI